MQRIMVLSDEDIHALAENKIVICTLKDGSKLNIMSEFKYQTMLSLMDEQTNDKEKNDVKD
jgi:hypothetical protein